MLRRLSRKSCRCLNTISTLLKNDKKNQDGVGFTFKRDIRCLRVEEIDDWHKGESQGHPDEESLPLDAVDEDGGDHDHEEILYEMVRWDNSNSFENAGKEETYPSPM